MGVVDFFVDLFLTIVAPTPRIREGNHRFLPSIALFATLVAFILSVLVLLAGKEPEFRKSEDIAIVRVGSKPRAVSRARTRQTSSVVCPAGVLATVYG